MKQSIIIPRRKLYEHILILEDFILDIERFVLYDKDSNNIYQYSKNQEFEPLLHEIVIKTIHLSNIFFTKKIFYTLEEFEQELELQNKRDLKRCIEEFKKHISNNFTKEETFDKFDALLTFIRENKRWGSNKELTAEFFKLIDSYHSLLIKIIEISN